MIENYIAPVIVVVTVQLALGWLLKNVKKNAKVIEGISWLEYGIRLKILTSFFVSIVMGLIVLYFIVDEKYDVILGVLLFSALVLPIAIEVFFVRIGFDNEKIYCYSGWRQNRVVEWNEVESAKFSEISQWWVLKTKKSGKVRVSIYLSGLEDFLEELSKRGLVKN